MNFLLLLGAAAAASVAAFAAPIVQVRDVDRAPTITVLGWDPAKAEFGLRTRLRRDGTHLGEGRAGDHRLYLNTSFVEANGGVARATAHTGKLLRFYSEKVQDVDACRFGSCSPSETVGLAVADDFLRENRDSLVVTLRPSTGRTWTIRLDANLIRAYLGAIDSVAVSVRNAQ